MIKLIFLHGEMYISKLIFVLFVITCDLLMSQIFTVASQYIVNTGRCVVDDRRSSLYSSVVTSIMCIKDWVTTKFYVQNCVAEHILEDFNNLHLRK